MNRGGNVTANPQPRDDLTDLPYIRSPRDKKSASSIQQTDKLRPSAPAPRFAQQNWEIEGERTSVHSDSPNRGVLLGALVHQLCGAVAVRWCSVRSGKSAAAAAAAARAGGDYQTISVRGAGRTWGVGRARLSLPARAVLRRASAVLHPHSGRRGRASRRRPPHAGRAASRAGRARRCRSRRAAAEPHQHHCAPRLGVRDARGTRDMSLLRRGRVASCAWAPLLLLTLCACWEALAAPASPPPATAASTTARRGYCERADPAWRAFLAPIAFEGRVQSVSAEGGEKFATMQVRRVLRQQDHWPRRDAVLRLQLAPSPAGCVSRFEILEPLKNKRNYIVFAERRGHSTVALGPPLKRSRKLLRRITAVYKPGYSEYLAPRLRPSDAVDLQLLASGSCARAASICPRDRKTCASSFHLVALNVGVEGLMTPPVARAGARAPASRCGGRKWSVSRDVSPRRARGRSVAHPSAAPQWPARSAPGAVLARRRYRSPYELSSRP
ncbi:hypothetical protein EVAR_66538_1 [Eumeta japonica]|uniref:Vein beta-barrel domain-containing protein n=1 Tax=Eumeta variegata TaxID=151549 RepID=A0A4C1ZC96_EUMVA|nr:hypothetical protein EVAR_66538_1 [Eumeta japonica]